MAKLSASATWDSRLKRELTLKAPIKPGKSPAARLIQEYLHVNGIKVAIDGDWGPATQTGLDSYFKTSVSSVTQAMMDDLAQPVLQAIAPVPAGSTLGATVVTLARQHLAAHPIEIGGPNAGPWVRLYMDGNQGKDWLWCAGFATYIVRHAAVLQGVTAPVRKLYSCDILASDAQKRGTFRKKGSLSPVPPGSIFLVPKTSTDWIHTGLILSDNGATLTTAEGNTDFGGSSNGWEATTRIRNKLNLDIFII